MVSPIEVACPNCQAPSGARCTVPTDAGRRPVSWFHASRENQASVTVVRSLVDVLARAVVAALYDDSSVMFLACECGRDVEMGSHVRDEDVRALIEHAAFDHAVRYEITVYRSSRLFSGDELGLLLRLPPVTDAEETWRRDRAADLT